MRQLALALLCLFSATGTLAARDSLFGRRVRDAGSSESAPSESGKSKPADEPQQAQEPDPFGKAAEKRREREKSESRREQEKAEGDSAGKEASAPKDEGVRVRPVTMDDGVEPKERMDFQLSRIDRPLARETSAVFREAWASFRRQNSLKDGVFTRVPQVPYSLRAKLLQDLGDGRWLVDAEWVNPGLYDWCPAGANADKAVLVLAAGEGKSGETVEVNAAHIGLVELRFDCEVPPAAGRRVTIRRHAFASVPILPDDEATRALFQQAVAAGRAPVTAVIAQERECKVCGGIGYVRRAVPGRIQDERDPCPGGCEKGDRWVPVLVNFKP